MPSLLRRAAPLAACLALGLVASPVHAQVHWDAAAGVGAGLRYAPGADHAWRDVGPVAQLAAHVALLPLVRVGAYAMYEIVPSEPRAIDAFTGGLRAKVVLPTASATRPYAFVGLGYAHLSPRDGDPLPGPSVSTSRPGGYLEVPVGLGLSHQLRKPWGLFGELGARIGFGHHGTLYLDENPRDRVVFGLTVGVLADL